MKKLYDKYLDWRNTLDDYMLGAFDASILWVIILFVFTVF